jgi:hypothetical protein
MLVSMGDLIWGAIGFATLALVITLVAVAWEVRHVLKVIATFASQLDRDVSPLLQDVQHIVHRVDSVAAIVGDKAEAAGALVGRVEESLHVGRERAQDAWDDTRVWLDSLKVGWHAGWQVFREGAAESEPELQTRCEVPAVVAPEAEAAPAIEPTPAVLVARDPAQEGRPSAAGE